MSTSETADFEMGKCPCGNGSIIKSVTTQDNPWSGADISYSVACKKCAAEWNMGHGSLSSRAETSILRQRESDQLKVEDEIRSIVAPLVDRYFDQLSMPTMAAEHRELQRLDITSGDIRQYRKSRNGGRNRISGICFPMRNKAWVEGLIAAAGKSDDYARAVERLDRARRACRDAASKVKHFPFSR